MAIPFYFHFWVDQEGVDVPSMPTAAAVVVVQSSLQPRVRWQSMGPSKLPVVAEQLAMAEEEAVEQFG